MLKNGRTVVEFGRSSIFARFFYVNERPLFIFDCVVLTTTVEKRDEGSEDEHTKRSE